MHGLKTGDFGH